MNAIKRFCFGYCGFGGRWCNFIYAVVRFSLGVFLCVFHGWGKLVQPSGSGHHIGPPTMLVEMTASLGFPAPLLSAWLSALAECLGGALVAIGLFTRPAAAVVVFNMGVAAFIAHANDPWTSPTGGHAKESAMLYLLPFLLFMALGAGRFSIDARLGRPRLTPAR